MVRDVRVGIGPVEAKPSQGFSPTPPLPRRWLPLEFGADLSIIAERRNAPAVGLSMHRQGHDARAARYVFRIARRRSAFSLRPPVLTLAVRTVLKRASPARLNYMREKRML